MCMKKQKPHMAFSKWLAYKVIIKKGSGQETFESHYFPRYLRNLYVGPQNR